MSAIADELSKFGHKVIFSTKLDLAAATYAAVHSDLLLIGVASHTYGEQICARIFRRERKSVVLVEDIPGSALRFSSEQGSPLYHLLDRVLVISPDDVDILRYWNFKDPVLMGPPPHWSTAIHAFQEWKKKGHGIRRIFINGIKDYGTNTVPTGAGGKRNLVHVIEVVFRRSFYLETLSHF